MAASPGPASSLCALRIYFRRGDQRRQSSFWKRAFGHNLAQELLDEALKAGLLYGAATFGQLGFVGDAVALSSTALVEGDHDGLPVCVELVGERPDLEEFVALHPDHLADAVLLLVEGVRLAAGQLEPARLTAAGGGE